MKWVKGKPPANFDGDWIVIEVSSLFSESKRYITARWLGDHWSSKEVERATQWAPLELPKKEEEE